MLKQASFVYYVYTKASYKNVCVFVCICMHTLSACLFLKFLGQLKVSYLSFSHQYILKIILMHFLSMETSINNTMLLSPDSQKVNAFKQFNLILFFNYHQHKFKINTAKQPVNSISLFFKYFSVPTVISTPQHLPLWVPRDPPLRFRHRRKACVFNFALVKQFSTSHYCPIPAPKSQRQIKFSLPFFLIFSSFIKLRICFFSFGTSKSHSEKFLLLFAETPCCPVAHVEESR